MMRKVSVVLALMALGFLLQAAPIPRPAPTFTILEPSGKQTTIASLKGKVVVLQFLYTTCPHCQETAVWLSRLDSEMKAKGVAVYGVAFNPEVNTKDAAKNAVLTKGFDSYAKFPVGMAPATEVERFLGFSVMDHYLVPQMAVIDKKGMIRAQTSVNPKPGEVIQEPVLRNVVAKLLAEK